MAREGKYTAKVLSMALRSHVRALSRCERCAAGYPATEHFHQEAQND
jgi:hypothetical protein